MILALKIDLLYKICCPFSIGEIVIGTATNLKYRITDMHYGRCRTGKHETYYNIDVVVIEKGYSYGDIFLHNHIKLFKREKVS